MIDSRDMPLAMRAMHFAREVHAHQRRKYTDNPYVDHLAEVAGIAATAMWNSLLVRPDELLATAWLHDCMEDQGIDSVTLQLEFGERVMAGVVMLSDTNLGIRSERKAADRRRLHAAPWWVQTIKVADMISNTSSIVMHDPKFAPLYLEEKRLMLAALDNADSALKAMAMQQLHHAEDLLGLRAPHIEPGEEHEELE